MESHSLGSYRSTYDPVLANQSLRGRSASRKDSLALKKRYREKQMVGCLQPPQSFSNQEVNKTEDKAHRARMARPLRRWKDPVTTMLSH